MCSIMTVSSCLTCSNYSVSSIHSYIHTYTHTPWTRYVTSWPPNSRLFYPDIWPCRSPERPDLNSVRTDLSSYSQFLCKLHVRGASCQCLSVRVHVCVCMSIYVRAIHLCVCMRICMCMSFSAYMCTCVSVYMHFLCTRCVHILCSHMHACIYEGN